MGAGVLVAILVGGCGSWAPVQPASPGTTPSVAPASPSTMWGPLAVVPPQDGSDTAAAEGTIRITDTCVFLETPGDSELLIWPADRTRWNAQARTITFVNFDGSTVSVGDGTRVVAGGGSDSNEESGATTEAWLARTRWVQRPDLSCPLNPRWWVGALMR